MFLPTRQATVGGVPRGPAPLPDAPGLLPLHPGLRRPGPGVRAEGLRRLSSSAAAPPRSTSCIRAASCSFFQWDTSVRGYGWNGGRATTETVWAGHARWRPVIQTAAVVPFRKFVFTLLALPGRATTRRPIVGVNNQTTSTLSVVPGTSRFHTAQPLQRWALW